MDDLSGPAEEDLRNALMKGYDKVRDAQGLIYEPSCDPAGKSAWRGWGGGLEAFGGMRGSRMWRRRSGVREGAIGSHTFAV